jgi:hypothetical protein
LVTLLKNVDGKNIGKLLKNVDEKKCWQHSQNDEKMFATFPKNVDRKNIDNSSKNY